jgi:AcrR family transcriptional regulator
MSAEKRTGRPRGDAPNLTRERILRAALALVDREGMAALSMRRLATTLGVDPMAIYYHLDGKAAVVAGLVELAFGELPVPAPDSDDWRAQVRAIAGAYRDLALSHPKILIEFFRL